MKRAHLWKAWIAGSADLKHPVNVVIIAGILILEVIGTVFSGQREAAVGFLGRGLSRREPCRMDSGPLLSRGDLGSATAGASSSSACSS